MKELYISPEAKLTCFMPVENLAAKDNESMDNLLGAAGGAGGKLSTVQSLPGFDLDFDA